MGVNDIQSPFWKLLKKDGRKNGLLPKQASIRAILGA
jgi:hypothetical protein